MTPPGRGWRPAVRRKAEVGRRWRQQQARYRAVSHDALVVGLFWAHPVRVKPSTISRISRILTGTSWRCEQAWRTPFWLAAGPGACAVCGRKKADGEAQQSTPCRDVTAFRSVATLRTLIALWPLRKFRAFR